MSALGFCEDCKQPSDFCKKCRACYRVWQERLYASIPRERQEMEELLKDMRADPQGSYAVAKSILRKEDRSMSGKTAELHMRCKKALGMAFGGSVEIALTGWLNRGEDDTKKPRGRLED